MKQPVLSIGIIFKNEIRCLERCLKSFQALREAIPCEIVMADTGSTDGSRAVAEKYADILFDFPWIDDFSAARNAVMDRCSGFWHLTVDADEWLGENISELLAFLNNKEQRRFDGAGLIVRNYFTEDLNGECTDFFAVRIVRMDTGVRYTGAIHEHWGDMNYNLLGLGKTLLNHDGYIAGTSAHAAKKKRNMERLKQELAQEPQKISTLMQAVESSAGTPEHGYYVHSAVAAVKRKQDGWEEFGPPIFRYAVNMAVADGLAETEQWIAEAKEWFPNSPFTTVDVACMELFCLTERGEHAAAIAAGERYLHGLKNYREGNFDVRDIFFSTLIMVTKTKEEQARCVLANEYFAEKMFQRAEEMLSTLDPSELEIGSIGNYLGIMMNLHAQGGIDMSKKLTDFWRKITEPIPDKAAAATRKKIAVTTASPAFANEYRDAEEQLGFCHSYTIFLPLAGRCELGTAAEILESNDKTVIANALRTVQDWAQFPVPALARALEHDVEFPLPGQPLTLEVMDGLAAELTQSRDTFLRLLREAEHEPHMQNWQKLLWHRGIVMIAVRTAAWSAKDPDIELGLSIAKAFSQVEMQFLHRCYTEEALAQENILTLPPLHRFGWYCAQAFDALKGGDVTGYVRLLREGLDVCGDMKSMVSFLADHTQEVQQAMTTPELRDLADQVRVILARFSPDDPEVAALKQTDAYQKVAHLIEGTAVPVWGGQQQ